MQCVVLLPYERLCLGASGSVGNGPLYPIELVTTLDRRSRRLRSQFYAIAQVRFIEPELHRSCDRLFRSRLIGHEGIGLCQ